MIISFWILIRDFTDFALVVFIYDTWNDFTDIRQTLTFTFSDWELL